MLSLSLNYIYIFEFLIWGVLLINLFYIFTIFFGSYQKDIVLYVLVSLEFLLGILLLGYVVYSYFFSNFTYFFVFIVNSSEQDFFYKLFAFWSTHEGSSFFWFLIFVFFSWSLLFFNYKFYILDFFFYFLLNLIKMFFYLYLMFFSNLFLSSSFYQFEGFSLNSVLQNPLLSIHPPILYFGYLSSIIIFVFLIYLILNFNFVLDSFSFFFILNLVSFLILSVGIFLGSFWAYSELGWGGFWFWDPIENISLFPWFLSIYVIHLFFEIKKYKKVAFTYFICQFFLFLFCIFGTFFLRSGLISSVHNFIIDFYRGFMLLILFLVLYFVAFFGLKLIVRLFNFRSKHISLLFCFLSILIFFFFCIFWFTLYNFSLKLYDSSVILFNIDNLFYNNLTFVFFIFIFNIYICYLWFEKASVNFFIIYIKFSLFFLFFSIISYYIWLLFLNFFSLVSSTKTFYYKIIHFLFFFLGVLVIISNNYTFDFVVLAQIGKCFSFWGYNICLLFPSYLNSFTFTPMFCSFYDFIIFTDDLKVCGIISLEKIYVLSSSVLKLKLEIVSSYLFDLHFILGDGNFIDGWVLKVILKPFFLFFWLCCIIFLLCLLFFVCKITILFLFF